LISSLFITPCPNEPVHHLTRGEKGEERRERREERGERKGKRK
jgi:hypothetical protein